MSLVILKSGWRSVAIITVMYAISWKIGPRFNGTQLYIDGLRLVCTAVPYSCATAPGSFQMQACCTCLFFSCRQSGRLHMWRVSFSFRMSVISGIKKLIPKYYWNRPSMYKCVDLLRSNNKKVLQNLAKFLFKCLYIYSVWFWYMMGTCAIHGKIVE